MRGDPAVCTSAGASRPTGPERPRSVQPCRSPWCRDRRADQRHRSAAGPPAPAAAALVRRRVPALGRRPRGGGRDSSRRESGRTCSTAAPTSGWSRSGWWVPGSRSARPRRGPARSWRPTCGSTRSTRRGGAASSSSASTPTGPSRSPPPAPPSGCPTAGPGWASPPTGRNGATPRRCGGRGAGPVAASRSGWAARRRTDRSNASSPPAGACTSPGPAGPAISPTPTRRGRCAPPSVLELDDGLVAAAGLGDLTRRPPDHVMFSEGVAATFGRPVPATRPRPGTVGGPS